MTSGSVREGLDSNNLKLRARDKSEGGRVIQCKGKREYLSAQGNSCHRFRAGRLFRGLFLICVHEFRLLVREAVKKSSRSVGKVRMWAQRERKLVCTKLAPVKARGTERIRGGELYLMKCFGFENQVSKFVEGEASRKTPFCADLDEHLGQISG